MAEADEVYAVTSDVVGKLQTVFDTNVELSRQHAPDLTYRRLILKHCDDLCNRALQDKYSRKMEYYKKKACQMADESGRFMKVEEVPNTRRLLTAGMDRGDQVLLACEENVNEMYMFYSDKTEQINRIVKEGFSICSKPVFFAESAQIADLNADAWFQGRTTALSMLLVRVILGRSYINWGNAQLNSLPCLKRHMKPSCPEHPFYFDSAVDFKDNGQRMVLMFDAERCIPDFRITYTRG